MSDAQMPELSLEQFYYPLPTELIAHEPLVKRDQAKLMVLDRFSGTINHQCFANLPSLLKSGDVLVRNNSKVIPARLFATKQSGGKVEILLSKPLDHTWLLWECLTKPGLKKHTEVSFDNSQLKAEIDNNQLRFITTADVQDILKKIGHTPLPPYIKTSLTESEQKLRYQTTFAKNPGSVAAPTAGLHFTKNLDHRLKAGGIDILEVDLHVGLGTFLPVKTPNIKEHKMHSEWFQLSSEVASKLNQAKHNHQRIIAVGTTSLRVLESSVDQSGRFIAQTRQTAIFIYPPHKFRTADGLITNFHLPETTLLMLISAFISAPNTDQPFKTFQESYLGQAYSLAISEKYRFFSFGDSMLIV